MAWHWPGDNPLSEAMVVKFTDAYKGYLAPNELNLHPLPFYLPI